MCGKGLVLWIHLSAWARLYNKNPAVTVRGRTQDLFSGFFNVARKPADQIAT